MSAGIYWFTNDLRVEDNLALRRAIQTENHLCCIYIIDEAQLSPNRYQLTPLGRHRQRFLMQSLAELEQALIAHGQRLQVFVGKTEQVFKSLLKDKNIARIHASENAGWNEKQIIDWLDQSERVQITLSHTHTLYEPEDLPFDISDLPETFSKFRNKVEKKKLAPKELIVTPLTWPEPYDSEIIKAAAMKSWQKNTFPDIENSQASESGFTGGWLAAERHLERYLSSKAASSYKLTRNALDDWQSSTKFSPWLSNGSLSASRVIREIEHYERKYGANDSTYWIKFELLWREYFQWYSHKYGRSLFKFSGISERKPLTSFYSHRFKQWCHGETAYPIVNACMKQLNATGYMSNRGRQLAASCLIHELQLDWRYGAAYFEQQLVDYDVASNWGNWQYLAGVGADPRGSRQFNLEKQTQLYDPEGEFIERWDGVSDMSKSQDAVDYVDWPIRG